MVILLRYIFIASFSFNDLKVVILMLMTKYVLKDQEKSKIMNCKTYHVKPNSKSKRILRCLSNCQIKCFQIFICNGRDLREGKIVITQIDWKCRFNIAILLLETIKKKIFCGVFWLGKKSESTVTILSTKSHGLVQEREVYPLLNNLRRPIYKMVYKNFQWHRKTWNILGDLRQNLKNKFLPKNVWGDHETRDKWKEGKSRGRWMELSFTRMGLSQRLEQDSKNVRWD